MRLSFLGTDFFVPIRTGESSERLEFHYGRDKTGAVRAGRRLNVKMAYIVGVSV